MKHPMLSKDELIAAASDITGDLKTLTVEQIARMMTVTRFVTDLCLNEIELRDELRHHNGKVVVPYLSGHKIETVLTRSHRATFRRVDKRAHTMRAFLKVPTYYTSRGRYRCQTSCSRQSGASARH